MYKPQTEWYETDDHRMVYTLKGTGKYQRGVEGMENDVAVSIDARGHSAEEQAEIAKVIREALAERFKCG